MHIYNFMILTSSLNKTQNKPQIHISYSVHMYNASWSIEAAERRWTESRDCPFNVYRKSKIVWIFISSSKRRG